MYSTSVCWALSGGRDRVRWPRLAITGGRNESFVTCHPASLTFIALVMVKSMCLSTEAMFVDWKCYVFYELCLHPCGLIIGMYTSIRLKNTMFYPDENAREFITENTVSNGYFFCL